ncbi:hypothetical protein WDW89_15320 [Deltaproteobacteria bacterium TL4]
MKNALTAFSGGHFLHRKKFKYDIYFLTIYSKNENDVLFAGIQFDEKVRLEHGILQILLPEKFQ